MREVIFNQVLPQTQIITEYPQEKIGLLGGTFNPPHLGHLILAEQVGQQLGLDRVLFLPTNIPPHKEVEDLPSKEDRKNMVEKAIENNPLFGFDDVDLEREGKSYTYETMKRLYEKYPNAEFYFIIGGDMVETLPKWHKIEELRSMVQFVGVKRPGYATETNYPIIWVDTPATDISSTVIRKKIKEGCSVKYLVPERTLDYIEQKRLYKNETKN